MTISYTPADLGTEIAGAALGVLPWVGAAVAAAIGIMFTFIGIRKGIAWGKSMVVGGAEPEIQTWNASEQRWMNDAELDEWNERQIDLYIDHGYDYDDYR